LHSMSQTDSFHPADEIGCLEKVLFKHSRELGGYIGKAILVSPELNEVPSRYGVMLPDGI